MNHKAIETLAGPGKSKGPAGGLAEPGTPCFSASFCPRSIHDNHRGGVFTPHSHSSHTSEMSARTQGNKGKAGSSLLPDAEEGGRIQRRETLWFSAAQLVCFHSMQESL